MVELAVDILRLEYDKYDKVVIITGFAEVGPWGSSQMRWEMEACGEFTIDVALGLQS